MFWIRKDFNLNELNSSSQTPRSCWCSLFRTWRINTQRSTVPSRVACPARWPASLTTAWPSTSTPSPPPTAATREGAVKRIGLEAGCCVETTEKFYDEKNCATSSVANHFYQDSAHHLQLSQRNVLLRGNLTWSWVFWKSLDVPLGITDYKVVLFAVLSKAFIFFFFRLQQWKFLAISAPPSVPATRGCAVERKKWDIELNVVSCHTVDS